MRKTEHSILHFPKHDLRNCVYMAVERNTCGVHLCDTDRFNYYPATPFPSISWILDGYLQMVENDEKTNSPRLGTPLPNVFFSGPTRSSSASWSPGPIRVLTVIFFPDALAKLLDCAMQQYVGLTLSLDKLLLRGKLDRLLTVQFDAATSPFEQVQQLLTPLWEKVPTQLIPNVRCWLEQLAIRTSSIASTMGQRKKQRLVKGWTGQSLRDLQLYARVENAMSCGTKNIKKNGLNFANIAAEAGFSDQSHLGREIRRVTGFPPEKLHNAIMSEEAFWIYRLLKSP